MYDYRKAKERYDAGLSTKQELQAARSYAGHKALSDAGTAANIFGQIIQGQAQAHGMNVDARTLE
jgi:hypothetical protein